MRFREAALVVGMVITTSKIASAERPSVALRYSVAEGAGGCPDEPTLRARVTEEVGFDPFVSDAARSLAIEISKDKAFTARVVDRAASGAETIRTLTSSVGCDDLVQSVVLAVAVSLDPEVEAKPVPQPPPPKKPEVAVLPVLVPVYVDRPPAPAPLPAETERLEGFVAAGFGVGGGFVPETSLGPTLGVGIRGRQWELSLEGTAQLPGSVESVIGNVEVFSILATVVPCYTPPLASWGRALVCGSLSMGGAFASASEVEVETPAVRLAAFTGPRAGIAFRVVPHFEIRVAGDLLVNLAPLEAQIRQLGSAITIYEGSPIAGRAITSMAVSFP